MPSSIESAAFTLKAPAGPEVPLVFDSPHSGFAFPSDFRPAATRAQVQTTWDAYVDELCAGVPTVGGALLVAEFPRAYIDTNRAANDVDPEVVEGPWPEPVALSEHSTRGMGLIRRFALPGIPMYDRRLTVAEVTARIHHCYMPYRRALRDRIDAVRLRHGAVWHFNCHSMKSRGNAMNRDQGALRPDFVVGDRDGSTAAPELTAFVAEFFIGRGYRVKVNDPYRGADIIRVHGDPADRRHSIQIEVNRALYLNEETCQRSAGFASLVAAMTAFARAAAGFARSELRRKATA